MGKNITKDLKSVILELQSGEPISLNRLSELAEQDNSTCESELKQLLSKNQIRGKYSDFSQVFIPDDTTLFCQVDGGNFPSSLAHHTCPSCGRYVCGRCIGQFVAVGLVTCVYCDTEFDPKPVIEAMASSKDLKVRSYGESLKLVNDGNYEAAVEAFREYLKDNEDDASGWFNLGYSLLNSKRNEEGIECLEKAAKLEPEDPYYLLLLGKILKYERPEEAILKFQQADKIRPVDAETLIEWGVALSDLGRYEEAILKFQQADKIRPVGSHTLENWAAILYNLGRHDEVILKFQQIEKIRPLDAETLRNWGDILNNLGRYDEAILKFQQADKIRPLDAETLRFWGSSLCNLKRFDEAILRFQQADRIQPVDVDTLENWGKALKKLKRLKEAMKMYQRAATAARTAGDISRAEKFEEWVKGIQS